eukprot:scaffold80228_cov68-Phaeocystis_antarctica.AAC.2
MTPSHHSLEHDAPPCSRAGSAATAISEARACRRRARRKPRVKGRRSPPLRTRAAPLSCLPLR